MACTIFLSAMPKRHSKKIKLLEHHSCSSLSSSSESESEEYVPTMPTTRPSFGPLESCDVLSKARMFIPLFAKADLPTESCDPELIETALVEVAEQVDPEHGVEMDISLGVFDVAGTVSDEKLASLGIPVVTACEPEPLIQEL